MSVNGLDEKVWMGIQSLLDDYAHIRSEDDVVIAYTPDSREPAAWVRLALEEREITPSIVSMIPRRDPDFFARLSAVIPLRRDRPGRCVCLIFELHTMSHNKAVKMALREYEPHQYEVIRAINSGPDLFTVGLATHPHELSALNTTILEEVRDASSVSITTESGSELAVTLDNKRFKWLSNRGVGQPGKFLIIPAGEVATFPASISGVFVADFAINVNMYYAGDVRLQDNPVTVRVEDGALKDFLCDDRQITEFLDKCFSRENATRVGELGLGTNRAVETAVPENSHLNERVPGVHLGFGQHNQSVEATGYACDVHVDLCARGGHLWFDGSSEFLDLTSIDGSPRPHPALLNSVDVFSDDAEEDCCGLLS